MFGPYHLDAGKQFLSYERFGRRWSVKDAQAEGNPLGLIGLKALEIIEVTERLSELRELRRPLVTDSDKRQLGDTFIYQGWVFQWVYSPILMRWELAIHGRE